MVCDEGVIRTLSSRTGKRTGKTGWEIGRLIKISWGTIRWKEIG